MNYSKLTISMQSKTRQGNGHKIKHSQCKNCIHTQRGYSHPVITLGLQDKK